MHRWVICFCFALAIPFVGIAQQKGVATAPTAHPQTDHATSPDGLETLLETKVRSAWSALKNRDKKAYSELLTGDFEAVEADGDGERSKTRILGEVEHSRITDYLLQLFQVQSLGPNYAFVTYESTMQFPSAPATRYRRVFIGELWTLREGQWKIMRYQETPVR